MAMRLESDKFNGKNDYGLWKMKIKAILIEKGCATVLEKPNPEDKGKAPALDEKAQARLVEMQLKAYGAVILNLGDKVLREIQEQKTAAEILERLDEIYCSKSLANRLYMKRRVYSYCFSSDKSILEQLEGFNKAVDDLVACDVRVSDEDKAILALNALPDSYDQLRDAISYGRDKRLLLQRCTQP